jgi:hypothetical protein
LQIPLAARAQQLDEMRRIGVLFLGNPIPGPFLKEFRDGLQKLGYGDGRNIQLEIRSAGPKASALPDRDAQSSVAKILVGKIERDKSRVPESTGKAEQKQRGRVRQKLNN